MKRERTLSWNPHASWLAKPESQSEIAYLVENFEHLTKHLRKELPGSLARSGSLLVIPLLLKALADPVVSEDVIFNLKLEYRSPAGEFGRMLAPAVLPLCGGNTAAMQLLFKLDREFAGKSLVTAENLAPGGDAAVCILSCCTEVGLPVPRELLDPLVVAWNQLASDKWRLGNAVRALALHSNSDALNEAEFMIRRR